MTLPQTTAACLCKPNVEGDACDTCQQGKFNLQASNPDGCSDCFCFGKTEYCKSHDALKRTYIRDSVQLNFNTKIVT